MPPEPTPILSLFGGVLIGLGAVVLLAANGRLAGVSSIFASAFSDGPRTEERSWKLAFLAGLVLTGFIGAAFYSDAFFFGIHRSLPALAMAGLLVGYGTRLGGGCTSGHGVCGNARLSARARTANQSS